MTRKIVPILEGIAHKRYCEPFGGGASILLAKRPVAVETYNDLDNGLYHFFMVLANPRQFARFYRRVQALPYSRQLFNDCRESWAETDDPVERAARWFVVARMSFSGRFDSGWSMVATASSRGRAATASKWMRILETLPEIHARLQRVQIENSDFRTIFEIYDTPSTLFYCDPPYVHSTRAAGEYAHEMKDADHEALIDILLRLRGKVALSGYPHEMYTRLEEHGWARQDYQTACYAAGRTRSSGIQGDGAALRMQARTECLWLSPHATVQPKLF